MKKLTAKDVTFSLSAEFDDTPVRGNAMASDEPELDKQCEDEIIARLERGDVWAWACVKVTAQWEDFEGVDYLGGCSYTDEKEFRADVYFEDMKDNALDDLNRKIEELGRKLRPLGEGA